jgi:hypothetical protein
MSILNSDVKAGNFNIENSDSVTVECAGQVSKSSFMSIVPDIF